MDLYSLSGSAVRFTTTQTLGLWQTYAVRINSSSWISIYNNANLVLQEYVSGLTASYLYDRTFYSCRIGQSWWSDGYADMDLRALLIYDYAMSDSDFESIQQYVYNLPVDDPPLLSPYLASAKVRRVSLAYCCLAKLLGPSSACYCCRLVDPVHDLANINYPLPTK